MATVNLYNNNNDKRAVNKTLTALRTVQALIVPGSSVIAPLLRIVWTNALTQYNYMYIPDFNRYYYITDIRADSGGACIITGKVDVLMTYATSFKQCPAIVIRSSRQAQRGSKHSTYIPDPQLPLSSGRSIRCVEFEGTDLNIDTATMTSTNFVLNVAGGGAISP